MTREYRVVRTPAIQRAGRNTGRTWIFCPETRFSFAVKAARPDVGSLALVAGLALAQAVNHPNAQLKWPNDLLLDGKKCAGILCEIERDYACVGIESLSRMRRKASLHWGRGMRQRH